MIPPSFSCSCWEFQPNEEGHVQTTALQWQLCTHNNLPVIVSNSPVAIYCLLQWLCSRLAGKPRISQLNGETPAGRGENSRLAGESDIISVGSTCFCEDSLSVCVIVCSSHHTTPHNCGSSPDLCRHSLFWVSAAVAAAPTRCSSHTV